MSVESRAKTNLALLKKQYGLCPYCLRQINPFLQLPDKMALSREHVMPRVLGGKNSLNNIMVAHSQCNLNRAAWPVKRVARYFRGYGEFTQLVVQYPAAVGLLEPELPTPMEMLV